MASWQNQSEKAIDDAFNFEDHNRLRERDEYLKQQHEIEHNATSGYHKDTVRFGDGTSSDKILEGQTADGAGDKPRVKWNHSNQTWEARQAGASKGSFPFASFKDFGGISGATALNLAAASSMLVTVSGNATLSAPSNIVEGQFFILHIHGAAGTTGPYTISWAANWVWDSGNPPSSIGNNDTLVILCLVSTGSEIHCHTVDRIFAELYENSTDFAVAFGGDVSTWKDVVGNASDLEAGPANLVSKTSGYKLTVSVGGIYLVHYELSFAGGNQGVYEMGVSVNNAAPAYKTRFRRTTTSTDIGAVSHSFYADYSGGDVVHVKAQDISSPAQDMTIYYLNFKIERIS